MRTVPPVAASKSRESALSSRAQPVPSGAMAAMRSVIAGLSLCRGDRSGHREQGKHEDEAAHGLDPIM